MTRGRLEIAVGRIRSEYAADRTEASGLPADAYRGLAVPDGHLVTGNEKARAIMFDTVSQLADDLDVVSRGCGRRDAISLEVDGS